MDILSFIASVIDSLAWPGAVALLLILLRKQLRALLPGLLRFRYKDLELEFGKRLRELEERVQVESEILPSAEPIQGQGSPTLPPLRAKGAGTVSDTEAESLVARLAPVSPRAAVTEAWRVVEHELVDLAEALELGCPYPVRKVAQELVARELWPQQSFELFDELRRLRNDAMHLREVDISTQDALEYADLSRRLVRRLAAIKQKQDRGSG